MKLNRVLTILGIALAVQLGAFAIVQWSAKQARTPRLLLPGLKAKPVDRIVLGGARANEKELTLEKRKETWVLREFDAFPADARTIEALLRTLLILQKKGPIATSASEHASLKIARGNAQGRVRLFSRDSNVPIADLTFGESIPSGAAYVRDSDDDDVFEVLGLAAWDVRSDPAAWLEQPYVEFPIEKVVAMRFERTDGNFTIRRDQGKWLVDERGRTRDADTTVVAETLKLLGSLAPAAPAGRNDGSLPGYSSQLVAVECDLREGAPVHFHFGTGATPARIAVASSERPHAAEVWKSSVDAILELNAMKASAK